MKHGRELSFDDGFDDDFDGEGKPVLITRAAIPYEEEHRQRVRKYLILMSWRIPSLVFAAIAYGIWHNGLISLAIIVAAIPLPWMAVLIANDRPPRRADEPRRYQAHRMTPVDHNSDRPVLDAGASDADAASQPRTSQPHTAHPGASEMPGDVPS